MIELLFILLQWFIYALGAVVVFAVLILGLVWILDHSAPTDDSQEELPSRNP